MLRLAALAIFFTLPKAAWSTLRPTDDGLRPAASWAALRPGEDGLGGVSPPVYHARAAVWKSGAGREDTTPELLQPLKLSRRKFPVQKVPGPPQPKGVMAAPEPLAPGPPAPNAPAALDEFTGLNYNTGIPPSAQFYPADTQAAVGINEIVVVSNTEVRYITKANPPVELFRQRLSDWWDTVPGAFIDDFNDGFAFDVKIVFDPRVSRYFFASLAGPATGFSQVMLAVSKTANPADGWWGTRVDYDGADRFWFDYPGLGLSDQWVVVTGVRFERDDQPSNPLYDGNCGVFGTSAACGTEMFRWDRTQIQSGNFSSMARTNFPGNPGDPADNAGDSVLMPAVAYDNTGGNDVYILQSGWIDDSAAANDSRLIRSFRMPAAGPPLVDQGLTAVVNSTYVFPTGGVGFPSAPQQGTGNRVALGDDRILSVVLRNSKLWATHTVGYPAGPPHAPPTQSQVAWYSFNLDGTLRQNALIRDTTPSQNYYWFPSIAVDEFENVGIGFNGSGTGQFVSSYYTGCYRGATTCTIQSELLYEGGKNTYNVLLGGVNRWGDFSATAPDPADPGVIWTIQEIVSSAANQYELRMAKFSMFPPPTAAPPGFVAALSGPATAGGQQVQIDWTTDTSATRYEALRGVSDCGTVVQTLAYSAAPLRFTAGSLDPNVTLTVCVRTVNPNGTGPNASFSTTTVAAPVTGITLGRTSNSITANFTPPNSLFAAGYQAEAYASGSCTGAPSVVVVVNNPSVAFVDIPGLQPSTNYCVRVGALNSRGAINYGTGGAGQNITTDTNLLPPVALPPTNITDTQIRVNWNAGGNPTGTLYSATASVTADYSGPIITSTTYNLFAVFSPLTPNTTYHFKVAPTSAPAKFTDLTAVATFAQPPSNLVFNGGDPGINSATLLFSKGANPNPGTTYFIEIDGDPDFSPPLAAFDRCENSVPCANLFVSGLTPNTPYFFRLRARNHDRSLSSAVTLNGATLPRAPLSPEYLSITFTSVTVRWTAPAGTRQGWRLEAGNGAGSFTPPIPAVSVLDPALTNLGLEGLDHDTTYIFRVGAIGVDGRINFTNFTSTKTPLAIFSTNTVTSTGTIVSFTPTYSSVIPTVTLAIPPGALPTGTVVRVDSNVQYIIGPQRSNQAKILPLGPSVAVDIRTDNGVQPGLPIPLTFTYNPAALPAGKNPRDLHICWFDPQAQVWDLLPSRVDTVANTVTAELPHFSLFAPFLVTAGTDLSGVEIFPVPWEPGSGSLFDAGGITFTSMPPSADVRIYTLRGELLWEGPASLTGVLFWDGKTRHGNKAASGVYLVNIVSGGQRLLRRLVISR